MVLWHLLHVEWLYSIYVSDQPSYLLTVNGGGDMGIGREM